METKYLDFATIFVFCFRLSFSLFFIAFRVKASRGEFHSEKLQSFIYKQFIHDNKLFIKNLMKNYDKKNAEFNMKNNAKIKIIFGPADTK